MFEEKLKDGIVLKAKIRGRQGVNFFGMPANPGDCYGVANNAGISGNYVLVDTIGKMTAIPGEPINKGDKITFKDGFVFKCQDNEPACGYALADVDIEADRILIFKTGA